MCYADDPDADYFLIRELTPGFLDGVSGTYKDPEGYFVCEKDPDGFERFEATFPVKEKQKLPTAVLKIPVAVLQESCFQLAINRIF